jgi:aspartate-semialdehyde dehydrogenase
MSYKVAVVGATGAVGGEMLNILAERKFPAGEVVALASKGSAGKEVSFGEDDILKVQALEDFEFEGCDVGLFSPGAAVSKIHAPRAAAAGCVVIDNTSQFRMDDDVPLIVPEVNREALAGFRERNIIANPNCSTIQLVMALKPLHDLALVRRMVVATYQSVSGAGREAMDELFEQTKGIYETRAPEPSHFPKQIAFNVIPHIDVFLDDGSSKEEWKMAVETKKILDPAIEVAATCVRVPVFVGHALAANAEFEHEITPDAAREALYEFEGVLLIDDPANGEYVTPASTPCSSPASARTPRCHTACRCGSSPTICARAPRSTPSRSPRRWSRRGICRVVVPRGSYGGLRRPLLPFKVRPIHKVTDTQASSQRSEALRTRITLYPFSSFLSSVRKRQSVPWAMIVWGVLWIIPAS